MNTIGSVLLVDDEGIVNYLHKRLITKLNLAKDVFIACNGKEALTLIEERHKSGNALPALVLVDINMPTCNGFEFIEQLLGSADSSVKEIPVAIVTSSSHPNDIEQAKKLGKPLVSKPLTSEKLHNLINQTFKLAIPFN